MLLKHNISRFHIQNGVISLWGIHLRFEIYYCVKQVFNKYYHAVWCHLSLPQNKYIFSLHLTQSTLQHWFKLLSFLVLLTWSCPIPLPGLYDSHCIWHWYVQYDVHCYTVLVFFMILYVDECSAHFCHLNHFCHSSPVVSIHINRLCQPQPFCQLLSPQSLSVLSTISSTYVT